MVVHMNHTLSQIWHSRQRNREVLDKDITKRLFMRILEGSMIWYKTGYHSDRTDQGFSSVHSTPPGDILNSREPL